MCVLPCELFCPPDQDSGLRSPLVLSDFLSFIISQIYMLCKDC